MDIFNMVLDLQFTIAMGIIARLTPDTNVRKPCSWPPGYQCHSSFIMQHYTVQ